MAESEERLIADVGDMGHMAIVDEAEISGAKSSKLDGQAGQDAAQMLGMYQGDIGIDGKMSCLDVNTVRTQTLMLEKKCQIQESFPCQG